MKEYKAPALAKGLDILEIIHEHSSLSFSEIQEKTNDNPASLSRYLQTLVAKGYISKNQEQKYELGVKFYNLTNNKEIWTKLKLEALPLMEKIQSNFGVTVLLIAYMNEKFVAIEKVVDINNISMMNKNNVCNNNISSIWSNMYYKINNLEQLDRIYEKLSDLEKASFSKSNAYNIYNGIKRNGYMMYKIDDKQILRLGFPIRYQQQVIASLGIGTFYSHINDEILEKIIIEINKGIYNIEERIK